MIYLTSPYSHPDPTVREQRFQAACAATARLLLDGQHVYCPVVHGHPLVRHGLSADWSFWERFDRSHLERSNEVVVLTLDGWRDSVGLLAELRHAADLRKPVRYVEPETLEASNESSVGSAGSVRGLACLACGSGRLRVVYTRDKSNGVVQRRRECRDCRGRLTTWERVVPGALRVPSG
jgi:hypothetical protein